MEPLDFDDPDVEEAWCDDRRAEVEGYLQEQGLAHGRIGEWPAWHVPPYVSVWAIESAVSPGAIGWWAICGDLPTDYIGSSGLGDPREALKAFCSRWGDASAAMDRGDRLPGLSIGRTPEQRRELADLLRARASLLAKWADDDAVWEGVLDQA